MPAIELGEHRGELVGVSTHDRGDDVVLRPEVVVQVAHRHVRGLSNVRQRRARHALPLHLSMAASKATADAGHGVPGSSIVTGMVMSCRAFSIRVSGCGDRWFPAPLPEPKGRFFEGYSAADVVWTGGESCTTEVTGLGGMAQAAAPALLEYHGGDFDRLVRNNLSMYEITRL